MWYLYDTLLQRVRGYEELHRQLSTFAVANLNCAVESDRQVVHEQIEILFGSIRLGLGLGLGLGWLGLA